MFNRKIAKKLTTSQREVSEHDEVLERIREEKKNSSSSRRYEENPPDPDQRSNSRIAAGFNNVNEGNSTSSRDPRRQRRSSQNFPPDRSTNEIQEEFDVDDADTFQYPTNNVLTRELLLEEYQELVNDSIDDVRTSDQSQQRLPVPMSPQVSRTPFNRKDSRNAMRKSNDRVGVGSSNSGGGSRNDNLKNIPESLLDDEDEEYDEEELIDAREFSRNASRTVSRSNSRSSRRAVNSEENPDNGGGFENKRNISRGRIASNLKVPPEGRASSSGGMPSNRITSNNGMSGVNSGGGISANRDASLNGMSSRDASLIGLTNREIASINSMTNRDGASFTLTNRDGGSLNSMTNSNAPSQVSGILANRDGSAILDSDRQPINYAANRLNSNNLIQNGNAPNPNPARGEVVPLPIEIPDSVTDADAFRRYLSVRRGAVFPTNSDDDVDDDERSTVESLGGRGSSLPAPIRSPSQMMPASFVNSTTSLMRAPPPNDPSADPNSSTPCPPEPPPNNNNLGFQKRTVSLSHAIMTLALLSASAAQLRFVVAYSHAHAYPTLNYFLICSCIIIEIFVGIGFVVLARFNFSEAFQDKLHSYLIFGLFVITVANVIVAAFALDDHICEVIMKRSIQQSNAAAASLDNRPFQPSLSFDDTALGMNRFNDI